MRVTLNRKKIAVIGGGVTGLTAAFYLQKEALEKNLPIDVLLIESSLRLGGKIKTLRKDGFVVEQGPESFLDYKNSVRQLAEDLGIEQKLLTNNKGQTYVFVGSKLFSIPNDMIFGGHFEVSSFIASNLLTLSGKLRAAGDLVLPKRRVLEDEPIGDFFRRRFGKEVVENLIEPLMAGTFAGDIDHLSIQAMFPQIFKLEKDYRSLLLGMKKTGSILRTESVESYLTFSNGIETLVETMESKLNPASIMKGVKVDFIDKLRDGSYQLYCDNIAPIKVDAIISTTPFNITKEMFSHLDLLEPYPNMKYSTIATVTLAFDKLDESKYNNLMNFFVSRNSDLVVTTCTWSNHKWKGVAPDDKELLRVYIGRVGDESIVELSDTDIENAVLKDLEIALNIKQKPLFTIVSRWKQAMPQYGVGHDERMEQIEKMFEKEHPNVKLVGSSYHGISVPDCVYQGRNAAIETIAKLTSNENLMTSH